MVTESEIFFFLLLRLRATLLDCGSAACTAMLPIFGLFLFRAADLCFLPCALFSILGPTRRQKTRLLSGHEARMTLISRRDITVNPSLDLRKQRLGMIVRQSSVINRLSSLVACPCSGLFALLLLFLCRYPDDDEPTNNRTEPFKGEGARQDLPTSPNTKCISV